MRNDKQTKNGQTSVRKLKIQPKIRFNRFSDAHFPEIRLAGDWLKDLGFQEGETVTVKCSPNLLIISTV